MASSMAPQPRRGRVRFRGEKQVPMTGHCSLRYELAIKDCDAIIHDVSGWLNKACSFTDPYDLTVNIRYELAIKDYGFYYTRLSLGSTKPAVAETLTIEL